MGIVAKNVNFYTVGIPFLFLYKVDDWNDENRVDWAALWRAYTGVVDYDSGHVLNANSITTCKTPEEILSKAYVGNLASAEVSGDIKTVEHTVSVLGRKETDKVVLIRKAIDYNISFDEMDVHLKNYLISKDVNYPDRKKIVAKTIARAPQGGADDFGEGEIEIMENALIQVGEDCSSLEYVLTRRLRDQGTHFGPFTDSGTDYYLGGIFYFLVADKEREPQIEDELEKYRSRIICGYFVYDPNEQLMKLQPFPSGMDTSAYSYEDTTIHSNIKMLVNKAESPVGIETNAIAADRSILEVSVEHYSWDVDSGDTTTQVFSVSLPPALMRGTLTLTITGKYWDGTEWKERTEVLYGLPTSSAATGDTAPIGLTDGTGSVLTDSTACSVNYKTGNVTLTINSTLVSDMQSNSMPTQTMQISLSFVSSENSYILWTGLTWAKDSKMFNSARVVRPRLEIEGTALVVFKNNVGVSFVHVLPRVVFKPDGTIDFAKDDWEKGSFVVSVIRDDTAFIPYLPTKVRVPFGFINTFRIYEEE